MGIKHFFSWYRKHDSFKTTISKNKPSNIDHVLIDMNGVIHEAAQQVFQYGKYASQKNNTIKIPQRFCKFKDQNLKTFGTEEELFAVIKKEVNRIITICIPKKTVFLGIDGVAPKGKQNQQRQRRFRAAKEKDHANPFDSSCITAGTDFMKRLSASLLPLNWLFVLPNVKISFSSEKEVGEGEHKLIDWIRKNDNIKDTYVVVGMDADLILLCAALNKQNVFIMRENEKRFYDWININLTKYVLKSLNTTPEDLIVWSCFIGNDFLPPIPTLEIKESEPEQGALDFFFSHKKKHLINIQTNCLNLQEIIRLLSLISDREYNIMTARSIEEKQDVVGNYTRFPNKLWEGNIEKYRNDYFEKKLIATSFQKSVLKKDVAYAFMKTVYWVYIYYTKGIADWDWYFPYNYSIHALEMVENIPNIIIYGLNKKTLPSHPHEQLLRVLPPESKMFVPKYLWDELERINQNAIFQIDPSGKRQLWEATTIVNFVYPKIKKYEDNE